MSTRKISVVVVSALFAALVVGLCAGPAWATTISVNYNRDYTNPGSYPDDPNEPMETPTAHFTNLRTGDQYVPDNSNLDLANGLTPWFNGTKHGVSGPTTKLTDGVMGSNGDDAGNSFFYDRAYTPGAFTGDIGIDLGAIYQIGQVNTYSWHVGYNYGNRANQKYDLWASDGTAEGFLYTDKTSNGWVQLTSVATAPHFGTTFDDGQFGVSIRPETGNSLGSYRYFIFSVYSPGTTEGGGYGPQDGTFYQEIDIVEAVPEPSTLALLAAGLVGLLAYAWRKRK